MVNRMNRKFLPSIIVTAIWTILLISCNKADRSSPESVPAPKEGLMDYPLPGAGAAPRTAVNSTKTMKAATTRTTVDWYSRNLASPGTLLCGALK